MVRSVCRVEMFRITDWYNSCVRILGVLNCLDCGCLSNCIWSVNDVIIGWGSEMPLYMFCVIVLLLPSHVVIVCFLELCFKVYITLF